MFKFDFSCRANVEKTAVNSVVNRLTVLALARSCCAPPPSHSLLFSGYLSPPPAFCCLQEHSEIPRKANLQRTCCWWVVQGVAMFRKRHPSRAANCSMSTYGVTMGSLSHRGRDQASAQLGGHWHLKSCFSHTLLFSFRVYPQFTLLSTLSSTSLIKPRLIPDMFTIQFKKMCI